MKFRLKILRSTEEEALKALQRKKQRAFKAGVTPGVFVGVQSEAEYPDLGRPLAEAAENLRLVTREMDRVGQVTQAAAAALDTFNEVLYDTINRIAIEPLMLQGCYAVRAEEIQPRCEEFLYVLKDAGLLPDATDWTLSVENDPIDPWTIHISFNPPYPTDEIPLAIGPDDYNESGDEQE